MIVGAHIMIPSTNADADIAFFRDVLKFPHVDAGGGFLIFGLPAAEAAIHTSDKPGAHELFLMCDDVHAFIETMKKAGHACSPVREQGWGSLTELTLPGGGKIGVYQAHHARPPAGP